MLLSENTYLDYSDVLIRPKRAKYVSRSEVELTRTFKMLHGAHDYTCVPIMAANMDHTGTREMCSVLSEFGMPTAFHKHQDEASLRFLAYNWRPGYYYGWFSIGIREGDLQTLMSAFDEFPRVSPNICIDVANGYTEEFGEYVQNVRRLFPKSRIMAGNVATPEATQHLLLQGADIVKIGIGPGSVCTTRIQTGVGVPQLTAVIECADAAHGMDGLVCADGGCTTSGDVAKAFGAGADFVMLGGMLAGHLECDGDYVYEDGSIVSVAASTQAEIFASNPIGMTFHGMASEYAQDKYTGGVPKYGTAEGKRVIVPWRGLVRSTVEDILGGLRGAMSMVGARELKHMSKCTTFLKVNNQVNNVFTGNEL